MSLLTQALWAGVIEIVVLLSLYTLIAINAKLAAILKELKKK